MVWRWPNVRWCHCGDVHRHGVPLQPLPAGEHCRGGRRRGMEEQSETKVEEVKEERLIEHLDECEWSLNYSAFWCDRKCDF